MPNKMLIDASHPEETRVVVTKGNRIEEFDFESSDKKQLRGNIYLARVTRVEPSLQAAFVEYGGNRHGFLAFSEIHPDYYQIPLADRQALLKAEAEHHEEEEDDEKSRGNKRRRDGKNRSRNSDKSRRGEAKADAGDAASDEEAAAPDADAAGEDAGEVLDEAKVAENAEEATDAAMPDEDDESGSATMLAEVETDEVSETPEEARAKNDNEADAEASDIEEVSSSANGEDDVESVGAEDALEELPSRRSAPRRHYKIQEVIKRRQILLVQVVKEERGNKGAALTTYLSLAGRYSVLMPNTARGGGISRKITSAVDRKRLKDLVQDLDVPQGMGVILRTAGANRTKAEIKRDYEYLMRMWENVRTLTLESTAPALVYEEGSLIKRSVRDLYNKEIEEILVAGDDGYREAKDFMRMLMPSHAKMVQPYKDVVPIFARNGIEAQLDRMLQPQVTLKSGGYIIINQTEALVSIDVNSGRSTREHSIEETALHTNLEAAEEVARQLRLRDLAGLIVIDFIDMEENRNNRAVEKRLKDHLKNDRARIQVGRISHFGLMEMSRQRIRASVLESTMKPCPHCDGTGHIRSDSSVALHVVRAIEEFLIKDARNEITVRTPTATALYVLNHKRRNLTELEERFGLTIGIEADETLGAQLYSITRGAPVERPVITTITELPSVKHVIDEVEDEDIIEAEADADADDHPGGATAAKAEDGEDGGRRKRRRRRRRRGGRDREGGEQLSGAQAADEHGDAEGDEDDDEDAPAAAEGEIEVIETAAEEAGDEAAEDDGEKRKRRRGKRGGRRNRKDEDEASPESADAEIGVEAVAEVIEPVEAVAEAPAEAVAEEPAEAAAEEPAAKPAKARRAPRKTKAAAKAEAEAEAIAAAAADVATAEPVASETPAEPVAEPAAERRPSRRRPDAEDLAPAAEPKVVSTVSEQAPAGDKPKKGGWWQRKSFF